MIVKRVEPLKSGVLHGYSFFSDEVTAISGHPVLSQLCRPCEQVLSSTGMSVLTCNLQPVWDFG